MDAGHGVLRSEGYLHDAIKRFQVLLGIFGFISDEIAALGFDENGIFIGRVGKLDDFKWPASGMEACAEGHDAYRHVRQLCDIDEMQELLPHDRQASGWALDDWLVE